MIDGLLYITLGVIIAFILLIFFKLFDDIGK